GLAIGLPRCRSGAGAGMGRTAGMMSRVSGLLAVVTGPRLETAEIRHVEVLPLQPRVVMVVVITSPGGVTKRIFPFEESVDPKLNEWAHADLNEQLPRVSLGAMTPRQRLFGPGPVRGRARLPGAAAAALPP